MTPAALVLAALLSPASADEVGVTDEPTPDAVLEVFEEEPDVASVRRRPGRGQYEIGTRTTRVGVGLAVGGVAGAAVGVGVALDGMPITGGIVGTASTIAFLAAAPTLATGVTMTGRAVGAPLTGSYLSWTLLGGGTAIFIGGLATQIPPSIGTLGAIAFVGSFAASGAQMAINHRHRHHPRRRPVLWADPTRRTAGLTLTW